MAYDFVIAGGGSAASVAAMRLVREFGFSVLMLERGPASTNRVMAMPAGYMKYLARDDFLEMHHTLPQPQLGGRGPIVPVAKALGGGSAVNAMVYMRGQREDYDGWAAGLGNGQAWSYADLLPHFTGHRGQRRLQRRLSRHRRQSAGLRRRATFPTPPRISCAPRRGWATPTMPISTAPGRTASASCSTPMGNGGATASARTPRRRSSIRSADDRRLTIITDARVDQILIEDGRAVGVALHAAWREPHRPRRARSAGRGRHLQYGASC